MFIHLQESRASAHINWEHKPHEKHHKCPGPTSIFFFLIFLLLSTMSHGMKPLYSIGVSCAGCVLSQLFVGLRPPLWGCTLGRGRGLDTVKALLSSAGMLTLSWWENQNSTIGDVMNGIISMAGRASTAVLVRSLPAGWGELLLHRRGHGWSNVSFGVPGKEIH